MNVWRSLKMLWFIGLNVKEAKPGNAPILYMYGAFGKRLATQDAVDELFKNKRCHGFTWLYWLVN